MAGTTTKIDYEVLRAQLECVRQDVDSGGGIAVAIPLVELRHITAEAQLHAPKSAIQGANATLPCGAARVLQSSRLLSPANRPPSTGSV